MTDADPAAQASRPARPRAIGELATSLRDEIRAFSLRGPRALLASRLVLAVAVAVAAAHALHLHDAWWAAITAFMVMQADFGTSLYRGALRVLGTLCGAGLGLVLGPPLAGHPLLFVLLMSAAAWAGLYAALVLQHSYAWVLALLTFVMVMCQGQVAGEPLAQFALERVGNIVLGTVACIVVAALTERRLIDALRRHGKPQLWTAMPSGRLSEAPVDRHAAVLHALHGAIVVALLSVIVGIIHLSAFSQALVTTIAVLIVPLEAGAIDTEGLVMQRMLHRLAGCLLAGAIAFALLPLIGGSVWWCQGVLWLGVWVGAWLQGGPASVRYVAGQFSVAFLMVFVQDSGWTVNARAALERLGGVFAGVAVLALVLVVSRRLRQPT